MIKYAVVPHSKHTLLMYNHLGRSLGFREGRLSTADILMNLTEGPEDKEEGLSNYILARGIITKEDFVWLSKIANHRSRHL